MRFRNLVFNNIKGNAYKYLMYYLSSVFSVTIFFIFASFILHPDVVNGEMHRVVQQGLVACQYIIIIFSFFFVLYSSSTFLKSRQKEFGLFALFGMTKGQIRKFVIYESLILSVLSIGTGILLGLLFSKLFLMIMGLLLQIKEPLAFVIIPKAIWITAVAFFLLFQGINLFTLIQIRRYQIIDLLTGFRKPKPLPVHSTGFVLLALLLLGTGYWLAWITGLNLIIITMFPILGLVITGTYFLFTQFSVLIMHWLQNRKRIFYNKTNLLVVSQLMFKLKDNARTLFLVSILTAVTLTASGTLYTLFSETRYQMMTSFPQAISFTEQGLNTHEIIQPAKIEEIVQKHSIRVTSMYQIISFRGKVSDTKKYEQYAPEKYYFIANRDYNQLAQQLKLPEMSVSPGEITLIFTHPTNSTAFFTKGTVIPIDINGHKTEFSVDQQINSQLINTMNSSTFIGVINDLQYKELLNTLPDQQKAVYYGYEFASWENTLKATQEMEELIPTEQKVKFYNRVSVYHDAQSATFLILFIGMFITLLFFIAAGSIIYFRLFTELQQDLVQFKALQRIGTTHKEIKKTITTQMGIIFFLPFVIGFFHSIFALKTLSNLYSKNVLGNGVVVGLFFLTFQVVFFLFAKMVYMNQLKKIQ